jgi:dihydropteroate synthase
MQIKPEYEDVVSEVTSFFHHRIQSAVQAGIAKERIAVDPGIGFGKTLEHNLTLLRNLDKFAELGCALLIGTSRKRMIGDITGRPVGERTAGSVASALHAAWSGADVVRVHDTAATVDAIRVWNALETTTGDVRHNHG